VAVQPRQTKRRRRRRDAVTFIMRSTKKVLHHLVKVRCWILTHLAQDKVSASKSTRQRAKHEKNAPAAPHQARERQIHRAPSRSRRLVATSATKTHEKREKSDRARRAAAKPLRHRKGLEREERAEEMRRTSVFSEVRRERQRQQTEGTTQPVP
jgi:hypothetical protein